MNISSSIKTLLSSDRKIFLWDTYYYQNARELFP
jgi:hypothetical protein